MSNTTANRKTERAIGQNTHGADDWSTLLRSRYFWDTVSLISSDARNMQIIAE